jgi:acetylornithine deacetylase/succinyl-diaminopimelate desuccinylase
VSRAGFCEREKSMKEEKINFSRFVSEKEIERLLCDLIAIQSHSEADGQERELAEYIKRLFRREKIESHLVPVIDGRSNVIASINGAGKDVSLLFNGHLDTVPPYAMKNPFKARISNGRIYGRGASDMKGAIAAMLGAMFAIKRSGINLGGTLMFAGTIGEEANSPGANHFVRSGVKADYALVGESTELKPCIAHKGIVRAEAIFNGVAVHSSVPQRGVNAIYKACRWIRFIESKYILRLAKTKHDLLGSPTINIGVINGGTRAATVPDRCSVVIDHRIVPGQTKKEALADLERTLREAAGHNRDFPGEIRELPHFGGVPHDIPLESSDKSPLVRALTGAYRAVFGKSVKPCGVPYWTDGALLAGIRGVEVAICGPGRIEQAHSNEEHLELRQLFAAFRIYGLTAMALCAKREK